MVINERELMKIRDMLGDINNLSKYVIYKDNEKAKRNRKQLKKLVKFIDTNDIGDVIDEICE